MTLNDKEKNFERSDKPQAASDKPVQKDAPLETKPATSNQQPAFAEASADKPATENMEVHKHPHHVTHKKKWGEYLLEFLMLFLAVFLGFIAENLRENAVEKHREKQYMQSLVSDLMNDTAMYSKGIQKKEERISAIDSVFRFFKTNYDVKTISGKFFRTLRRTTFDQRLIRNIITINQLKNAGGMRLVRNQPIADSISAYDARCADYDLYNEDYILQGQVGFRNLEKLVNAPDLLDFYVSNTTEGIKENIPDSLIIRINNNELNEKLNFMMQQKAIARQEIIRFKDLRQRAINLIKLIKKEYHLE